MPETRTQPENARSSASSFFRVSFSRKNTADMSMIQMGDVYSRIAAAESVIISIAVK